MSQKPLLEVKNLQTEFPYDKNKTVPAVHHINFRMEEGEILGLVGESGCGKSVTALSIMGLVSNSNGIITEGEIFFKGQDLLKMPKDERRQIRGGAMAMIFQEPMSSLNPAMRIDKQIMEAIRLHTDATPEEARAQTRKLLVMVGIPDPDRVMKNYPHQLSGGMSQRVMIALAMSCQPELLIADEPTTALDVTIQAQILELLRDIQKEKNTGILLITHDLGVVAEMCDRVIVMYAGEIVESAICDELFEAPLHPYTQGLIASVPKLGSGRTSLPWIPGSVPDLLSMPQACRFAPRCPYATDKCRADKPELEEQVPGHQVRCWHSQDLAAAKQ
ncbi:MAG: ABC transporter ATP-binding protein [Eubacteriales bacterium]|nr:ABC transporter ATP-binding protein [Eubacteriales bacterium]